MRTAAIVAEYNPFHNGHACHLQKTREAGAEAVFAVMSGNFVQRGEPAAFSKWARAEAAVRCGVDLVLELPVFWAASTAQRFACGAVSVVRHTGVADMLSFGSECGDARRIKDAAQLLDSMEIPDTLLRSGRTFASAREEAVRAVDGSLADLLHAPNDTLAVEYARAVFGSGMDISLLAVPRIGAHDGEPVSRYASASHIRSDLSWRTIEAYCPPQSAQILRREIDAGRAPADIRWLERALLLRLRTSTPEQIAALPDVSEGLENRILAAARESSSLEELTGRIKTKRYPLSRIRRILLSSLLQINASDVPQDVPYLRVLAIGQRGEALLREMKRKADIPIVTRMTRIGVGDDDAARTFRAENRAGEVFSLLQPNTQPGGGEYTHAVPVVYTV